jgi:hypothetical protein
VVEPSLLTASDQLAAVERELAAAAAAAVAVATVYDACKQEATVAEVAGAARQEAVWALSQQVRSRPKLNV